MKGRTMRIGKTDGNSKSRRAWLAVGALMGGSACAHTHASVPVAPEDRATAIVRRWSRNEATAEEVQELAGQFMRLPTPLLVEAMHAAETVGQPRRVDNAFRCRPDASADAPLECAINTGGDQFHGNVQAGLDCWYVTGGDRCEAAILSCREAGTGTEGASCDGRDVCFAAESGGVSVRSVRGVRLLRTENLPDIPYSLRCRPRGSDRIPFSGDGGLAPTSLAPRRPNCHACVAASVGLI